MSAPLISAQIPPEAAHNENARRELQGRLAGLGDLNGKKLSPEQKAKKLREACEGFESVFIQKMWQEMRNTLPKGGLLQGREEKFWQDMYDQELSKKMTSAGGIGLADMMYAQLSRNLVSASRSAAGTAHAPGFTPGAAPLLPAAAQDPAGMAQKASNVPTTSADPGSAAGVYEGVAPQIGGLEAERAAATPAGGEPGGASSALPSSPPEVEQALAALRAQQASAAPAQAHIEVVPAGQGVRRRYGPSGLDLARMARREAGTRLGPASVRPPLQTAMRQTDPALQTTQGAATLAPAAGEHAPTAGPGAQAGIGTAAARQAAMQPGAQPVPQPAAALSTPAASTLSALAPETGPASGQAAQQAAVQAAHAQQAQAAPVAQVPHEAQTPQIRKVRYTTNVPPKGRNRRSQALIRTLSTDAAGAGSRAGAGLAAYHAAQAQAQAAPAASPAAAQSPARTPIQASGQAPIPGAPGQEAAAVQPLAAPAAADGSATGNGRGEAAGSYAIPPLTAADLRG